MTASCWLWQFGWDKWPARNVKSRLAAVNAGAPHDRNKAGKGCRPSVCLQSVNVDTVEDVLLLEGCGLNYTHTKPPMNA